MALPVFSANETVENRPIAPTAPLDEHILQGDFFFVASFVASFVDPVPRR
jgi:hypothetical protein